MVGKRWVRVEGVGFKDLLGYLVFFVWESGSYWRFVSWEERDGRGRGGGDLEGKEGEFGKFDLVVLKNYEVEMRIGSLVGREGWEWKEGFVGAWTREIVVAD